MLGIPCRTIIAILGALLLGFAVNGADQNDACILFNSSYGERLPGSTADVTLWWASSGWKIAKTRPVPRRSGKAALISAARNEAEAAQLVVHPAKPLSGFIASANALTGPNGATIAAENIDVLRVRYVNIQQQTDAWGAIAPWPDPLPPFKGPIDVAANENQPLWVRVHVPKGTPAGDYKGTISLRADGYKAEAPLQVHVYDFELPDKMTCETAFGFGEGYVYSYQKLTDPAQRREVLEKYLASLSAHHISPYDPAMGVEVKVEWVKLGPNEGGDLPEADRALMQKYPLKPVFDWTAWDAEMQRVFDKYHFDSFRLGFPGIGDGDYQGFKQGTRERDLAFTNYCRAIESHYREKGWLDKAYVYWTDEPTTSDYPGVMAGFKRLKEAAPGLRRMLTEQPEPELYGGPNLWCPMTCTFHQEETVEPRKMGDRFWWYVCTVPKQPYYGLFIDHPATDFRVWLWQTWKEDIDGILIWHSNLWTTGAAYPDKPQNPYEDPMSWDHGGKLKAGDKRPWGNGDGRFMYPPEAAADANPPEPVLDGPVDTIRWEILRDGIEDYEYLAILKRLGEENRDRLPKRALANIAKFLKVPGEIVTDAKTYTKDPAPIEKRRHAVARTIERVSRVLAR